MATQDSSGNDTDLKESVMKRLSSLKPDSTMCPGRLASDHDMELSDLRPYLRELHEDDRIELLQSGEKKASMEDIKGPFRVRLSDKERDDSSD